MVGDGIHDRRVQWTTPTGTNHWTKPPPLLGPGWRPPDERHDEPDDDEGELPPWFHDVLAEEERYWGALLPGVA